MRWKIAVTCRLYNFFFSFWPAFLAKIPIRILVQFHSHLHIRQLWWLLVWWLCLMFHFYLPLFFFVSMHLLKNDLIQSNLAIRNFSVALKLFFNAKSSLSLRSKWQIGHRKWFLNTNLLLIKPFLISKFDSIMKSYKLY